MNATKFALPVVIAALAGGCGDELGTPEDGDAYLSIVGDANVSVESGQNLTLEVRYHDGNGKPLAGTVDFRLVGEDGGATLSRPSSTTNSSGVAEIKVVGGDPDLSFEVEASTDFAPRVTWTVDVTEGVIPDLDPVGTYELDSKFDIVSGVDHPVGTAVDVFVDMTDGEHDPATWVIDQVLAQAPSYISGPAQLLRGVIDPVINAVIMDKAPDFVDNILQIGQNVGSVTRNFGTNSVLTVAKNGTTFTAMHRFTGFNFEIDGSLYLFTLDQAGVAEESAENVDVFKDDQNKLNIGSHVMPLSYGTIIAVALDEAIIPMVDPFATDLGEFLQNKVDCADVGDSLDENIGFGGAGLYEGLCDIALVAGAELVYAQLDQLDDAGVSFDLVGIARPRDTNNDGKVDSFSGGKWAGELSYPGSISSALSDETNTFTGSRVK